MRICTAKGHGPVLFLPKRCAIDAGNGAPGRVLGPGRRVRRCRRVATYLRCSRDAPRGPPCLRPIGGCPRTPAPSRAWRARLPHLPRDFPACRCAAQRGSGGRPWAPRCAYHASRRSLGFVRFRTKGLGRAGASRRARTHRFPAVINRVSETPAWKCFCHLGRTSRGAPRANLLCNLLSSQKNSASRRLARLRTHSERTPPWLNS
jgi:hypothetical protein